MRPDVPVDSARELNLNVAEKKFTRRYRFAMSRCFCGLFVFCVATVVTCSAQRFSLLYTFTSNANGSTPLTAPIQGLDGNLYGTTSYGGSEERGSVYKITPAGELTTLYSFCSQLNCSDGWFPTTQLIQGMDGNFYGTVADGGSVNYDCLPGAARSSELLRQG